MPRVPETQLKSWDELQGTIGAKQQAVLSLIKKSSNGLALFQISKFLQWPINRVSGRVTELKNFGLIVDSGNRVVNPESGKKAIVWKSK